MPDVIAKAAQRRVRTDQCEERIRGLVLVPLATKLPRCFHAGHTQQAMNQLARRETWVERRRAHHARRRSTKERRSAAPVLPLLIAVWLSQGDRALVYRMNEGYGQGNRSGRLTNEQMIGRWEEH